MPTNIGVTDSNVLTNLNKQDNNDDRYVSNMQERNRRNLKNNNKNDDRKNTNMANINTHVLNTNNENLNKHNNVNISR